VPISKEKPEGFRRTYPILNHWRLQRRPKKSSKIAKKVNNDGFKNRFHSEWGFCLINQFSKIAILSFAISRFISKIVILFIHQSPLLNGFLFIYSDMTTLSMNLKYLSPQSSYPAFRKSHWPRSAQSWGRLG